MKKEREIRSIWLTIRLKKTEQKKLDKLYRKTCCQSLCEYSRAMLLRKPVIVRFRNSSLDDFYDEIVRLRKELNAIGNNFNQAVQKLHILDKIPDIKAWAILNEATKKILMNKEEEILKKVNEIYDKLELEPPPKEDTNEQ